MSWLNNPGRRAGLLYLLGSIPGFFGLLYVPGKLMVHGNPTATAHNIAASQTLFRLGIFSNLAGQTIFIFVALALYHLFKQVNQRHAVLMVVLLLVSIPIAFLNELNSVAALTLAHGANLGPNFGADFLSAFNEPQRIAFMRLFLNLRGAGFDIAEIFWGLWLFPLGLLVYRSGFLPRILGILLMAGCFAYLATSFTSLVMPQYESAVSRWASPLQLVEMLFMAWLLIMGAIPQPPP
jgi:hypothetical protein